MADARGSTATVKLAATLDGVEVARTASSPRAAPSSPSGASSPPTRRAATRPSPRSADDRRGGAPSAASSAKARRSRSIRAEADGHETEPPPRYTEATLVKAMEEQGHRAPSTYAVDHRHDPGPRLRGHPRQRAGADLAGLRRDAAARGALRQLVDYDFTASMEEDLDRIANGEEQRVAWLSASTSATRRPRPRASTARRRPRRDRRPRDLDDPARRRHGRPRRPLRPLRRGGRARPASTREPARCSSTGAGGARDAAPRHDHRRHRPRRDDARQGPRAARRGRRRRTSARPGPLDRPRDRRQGGSLRALRHRGAAGDRDRRRGAQARQGRAKAKPRTASLFKDMDLATIDLDAALQLLSLPRVVGTVAEEDGTSVDITAQNGRYGPYLKKGTDSRSLVTEEQLFDDHPRRGARDLRPAEAARPRRRAPRSRSSAPTRCRARR